MCVGKYGPSYWKGHIADVRVYNKARFVVQAAEKWNPSNVQLVKGGKYRVYVPGRTNGVLQRWNDTRITVGANGYSSHYDAISKCNVALGKSPENGAPA